MKPIYINRDNGGDISTAAVIYPPDKSFAQLLATRASQQCNGHVQYYVSQRGCKDLPHASISARFIRESDPWN